MAPETAHRASIYRPDGIDRDDLAIGGCSGGPPAPPALANRGSELGPSRRRSRIDGERWALGADLAPFKVCPPLQSDCPEYWCRMHIERV